MLIQPPDLLMRLLIMISDWAQQVTAFLSACTMDGLMLPALSEKVLVNKDSLLVCLTKTCINYLNLFHEGDSDFMVSLTNGVL